MILFSSGSHARTEKYQLISAIGF